jgi:hypothetical protein
LEAAPLARFTFGQSAKLNLCRPVGSANDPRKIRLLSRNPPVPWKIFPETGLAR